MNQQIDITGVVLSTSRLTLRPWRKSDLNDFYEYARVDGVGQMAGWSPHQSSEESRGILECFIKGKHVFALEHGGKVIGSLGIEEYNEACYPEFQRLRGREIGYVLSKDYWGRGLMPEAVQAAVAYLLTRLDWISLLWGTLHTTASPGVLLKSAVFNTVHQRKHLVTLSQEQTVSTSPTLL